MTSKKSIRRQLCITWGALAFVLAGTSAALADPHSGVRRFDAEEIASPADGSDSGEESIRSVDGTGRPNDEPGEESIRSVDGTGRLNDESGEESIRSVDGTGRPLGGAAEETIHSVDGTGAPRALIPAALEATPPARPPPEDPEG